MQKMTTAEVFEESNSDTLSYRGKIVRSIVRIPVADNSLVMEERISVASPRPQAIKHGFSKGVIDVNGYRGPEIALWSHNSPQVVEMKVRGDDATVLEIWNAWSMGGVDTSWIGNAGIVTKSSAEGEILQCSDGFDQATFSDLVVRISIN